MTTEPRTDAARPGDGINLTEQRMTAESRAAMYPEPPRTDHTFAAHLTTTERLRRDLEAVTAQRDRFDREATTWKHRLVEETADLRDERDQALEARDVLRAQLDQARAELGRAQELIAVIDDATERIDRARTAYATRPQLATGGIVTTTPKIGTDSCVIPRSPVLGSADSHAQGIRPAAWEQHATNAISAALSQTWDWSDGSVMPARIAEVAVRAVVDAGLAGPGGRCPTCGETYPRTMPAGEDQRCWTCSTEEVVGLPEYTRSAQDARRRHTAAFNALSRTLLPDAYARWVPLSVRERCTEAVLAALDALEPTAEPCTQGEPDVWTVPKIGHDENRLVGPHIHGRWIHRAAGQSDSEHTRLYAAQLLAAADEAERREC